MMSVGALFACLLVLPVLAYIVGQQRALRMGLMLGGIYRLHSLPFYYGMMAAIYCGVPALVLAGLWLLVGDSVNVSVLLSHVPDSWSNLTDSERALLLNTVKNVAAGQSIVGQPDDIVQVADLYRGVVSRSHAVSVIVLLTMAVCGFAWGVFSIKPEQPARLQVELVGRIFLVACACVAILTTVGIVVSVLFESLRFFKVVSWWQFLFGLDWSPQIAMRADQAGSSGAFGAVPLFAGTLLISMIAMLVAVPAGLMSAIYLSEYANSELRRWMKPLLELLAGIPTVVYGFFAALTVAPFIREIGESMGMVVSSESALAAGLVMGVMIIPFISSLSDDVINAVPQAMRDGSYALGATQAETIINVIIPAALPGIVGGVLLAVSRAIGETMIVVMAAGMSAKLTANPLEAVTTVTVQIASLLVGDQEFDSAKTLAAFALGLVLFVVTLLFNVIALRIVRKYREQYE
ncbi:MAG TPA: phosphate ABC transporter permease subunit PstC [Pseudomonadales bacterium]|nr:phosphate ABC transporter permease subunit PstC [Pseudomonadales bacterium]